MGILGIFGVILTLYLFGRFGVNFGRAGVLFQSHAGASPAAAYAGDGVIVLLTIAIFWLTEALRSIGKGGLFSRQVVRQFRQFALWLLLMALFSFLAPLVLARTEAGPHFPHKVMIALDLRDLLLIGITALLFLIARLLERAGEIEQENQEIV